MHIYVKDIMQSEVTKVFSDVSVEEAESVMLKTNRRCVPVVDSRGKCYGVISYIDILRLKQNKEDLSRKLVSEMCSAEVQSVSPHSSVDDAMALMLQHGIHHVFVLLDGYIKGIISVMDIIQINRGMLFNPDEELRSHAPAY